MMSGDAEGGEDKSGEDEGDRRLAGMAVKAREYIRRETAMMITDKLERIVPLAPE